MAAIVIIVLILLGALGLWISTRPGTFRIERSIVVAASPPRVFALIDNFDAWQRWSPWEGKDPALKRTRSGPASGLGSVYAWEGNKAVGKGRMEIIESAPPVRVGIQLDFLAPFEAHNRAEFTLVPQDGGTQVSWVMSGPANLMTKLMVATGMMERMVGPDFEQGLRQLKASAEQDTPQIPA